jgi:hypothetical protein
MPFSSSEHLQRRLNALRLCFCNQGGQHLDEMRMLRAGKDVLPSICSQQAGFEPVPLVLRQRPAAGLGEIPGVFGGLQLENAVDGGDKADELIDSLIALQRT